MNKIPEQIVNAAQELVNRFGNKLAFIGKQGDNFVYQFRFPKDLDTGFPFIYIMEGDTVISKTGFEALDIIKSLVKD